MVYDGTAYTNWSEAWPWFATFSFALAILNFLGFVIASIILYVTEEYNSVEDPLITTLLVSVQVPMLILILVKIFMIILEAIWPEVGIFQVNGYPGTAHLWELGPDSVKLILILVNFTTKYLVSAFWIEI